MSSRVVACGLLCGSEHLSPGHAAVRKLCLRMLLYLAAIQHVS